MMKDSIINKMSILTWDKLRHPLTEVAVSSIKDVWKIYFADYLLKHSCLSW